MVNVNHRLDVLDLLEEWADNTHQAQNIINTLVEFLASDIWWLDENISKVDRETLVVLAKRLERNKAPN